MKKIILILLLCMALFSAPNIFAATTVTVSVSEDLTELGITCVWDASKLNPRDGSFEYYNCEVEKWSSSIQKMLWKLIKYATFLASLVWVLFIVINGMLYSISGGEQKENKENIVKAIWWLLLLLLSWVVLNAIAPWIYSI